MCLSGTSRPRYRRRRTTSTGIRSPRTSMRSTGRWLALGNEYFFVFVELFPLQVFFRSCFSHYCFHFIIFFFWLLSLLICIFVANECLVFKVPR
jgi:hypothetical protein